MQEKNPPPMIDAALARSLVADQFPHWAGLPLELGPRSGWDNRTFRLGRHMLVRMPSGAAYAQQVKKEHRWLPQLAPLLPLAIPRPLAMGSPGRAYPWHWSVYGWIEGDTAGRGSIADMDEFAASLARFLLALRRIDASGGPAPGLHSFHRGGRLVVYDRETRQAIAALGRHIDNDAATRIWQAGLASAWNAEPVWVHGDISVGNLLVRQGQLHAVIDFGQMTTGDPACDAVIAWTLFEGSSRKVFQEELALDAATWLRARAWALWKAMIVAAGFVKTNAEEWSKPWKVIRELLAAQ
ncbi:aminoglycoside phosphotransferase family protein [Noviherbaspirillum sp. 1P10PC]|uniref:aminoglycoside phosphotransferase family protein n=1 Tax=Noviherbaspirillum sp. 1P10PC TaxID=3132292 RepID=UPI0039A394A9